MNTNSIAAESTMMADAELIELVADALQSLPGWQQAFRLRGEAEDVARAALDASGIAQLREENERLRARVRGIEERASGLREDLHQLIRVALTNPGGLRGFVEANYPGEHAHLNKPSKAGQSIKQGLEEALAWAEGEDVPVRVTSYQDELRQLVASAMAERRVPGSTLTPINDGWWSVLLMDADAALSVVLPRIKELEETVKYWQNEAGADRVYED